MRAALAIRPFRRLAPAYAINALGNWLAEIALVLLVFETTGSALGVAALMVAGQLAPALFVPALVARLDGRRARRVLPSLHLIQAALLAMLALAGGEAGVPLIVAVVFADGLLGGVARALTRASVVAAAEPLGLLREANSVVTVLATTSAALGPALAGLLTAAIGVGGVLALDALSFVIAAALLAAGPLPAPVTDHDEAAPLRSALAYVRTQPQLRTLLSADALVCVLMAMIIPVEVVFLSDTLHSGPAALGVVLTAWGAGAVAGSLLSSQLPRVDTRLLLLAAMLTMIASYLGMGAAGTVAVVAAFSLLGGIGNGLEAVAALTVVQEATAEAFQTRVGGLTESVRMAGPGLGFVLGGMLATGASPRAVYMFAALGALAVVAWAALALRDAPEPALGFAT